MADKKDISPGSDASLKRGKRPLGPDMGQAPQFDPEYVARARELCARGAGESDLAAALGVSVWAVKLWRTTRQDFADAVRLGQETADDRVSMALYERAIGYNYDAVKPMNVSMGGNHGSEIVDHPYVEHVPPDVAACRYWLNNRRPDLWRERVEQVNVNRDDVKQLTDAELTKVVRAAGASGSDGAAGEARGQKESGSVH